MSIKKHFRGKGETPRKKQSLKDFVLEGDHSESVEYLRIHDKFRETFLPPVNYNDPTNIARFASATKTYETAVTKIYEFFPYDGTLAEKLEWQFMNSYLERFVFENEYPRNNGHIKFSSTVTTPPADAGWGARDANPALSTDLYGMPASTEYIRIKGGPHSTLIPGKHSQSQFQFDRLKGDNTYTWDNTTNDWMTMRLSNLYSSGELGNTVEFWFKRDENSYNEANTKREVIFDMWNQLSTVTVQGVALPDGNYGRFRIEYCEEEDILNPGNSHPVFYLAYIGPDQNVDDQAIAVSRGVVDCPLDFISRRDLDFYQEWHHIAISVENNGSDLDIRFHLDGNIIETRKAIGQAVAVIPAPHIADIGALQTSHELELDHWLLDVQNIAPACLGGQQRGSHGVRVEISQPPSWPLIIPAQLRPESEGLLTDDGQAIRSIQDSNALYYILRVYGRNIEDQFPDLCDEDDPGERGPHGGVNVDHLFGPDPDPDFPGWQEFLTRAMDSRQVNSTLTPGTDLIARGWNPGSTPTSFLILYDEIWNPFGDGLPWPLCRIAGSLFANFTAVRPDGTASPTRTFPNGEFKFVVEVKNSIGITIVKLEEEITLECP